MRPSELCPQCGGGHAMCLQAEESNTVFYRCTDCWSGWRVTGQVNEQLARSRNLILSMR